MAGRSLEAWVNCGLLLHARMGLLEYDVPFSHRRAHAPFGMNRGLNWQDSEGSTPLHLAARLGRAKVCALLLKNGADVSIINAAGKSLWTAKSSC